MYEQEQANREKKVNQFRNSLEKQIEDKRQAQLRK